MTDTMWAMLAFVGLGIVVVANALRARRTENLNCLGHFFVSADDMTTVEHILNRSGIVIFVVGVVVSIVV